MLVNHKAGLSFYRLAKDIDVTQKQRGLCYTK